MENTQVRNLAAATPELVARLQRSVQSVIRGKDEVIELALVALLARGHLLIEDVPGVAIVQLRVPPRAIHLRHVALGRAGREHLQPASRPI